MEEEDFEEEELEETIDNLLSIDPSDFITMATALLDAFRNTGYGSGKIDIDNEGHPRLTLHTGGWSENEEIISAIMDGHYCHTVNLFWAMYWYQSTSGGHYVFVDCMKRD